MRNNFFHQFSFHFFVLLLFVSVVGVANCCSNALILVYFYRSVMEMTSCILGISVSSNI
jgi:hypothetical protein